MDYNQFRASNGISRGDMIKTVKEICPKYSKATQSMVDNPDKYGVCLLPGQTAEGRSTRPGPAEAVGRCL